MAIRNIKGISTVLLIIVIVSVYFFITNSEKTTATAFEMIPDNAAVIFQVSQPGELLQNLNADNDIWRKLNKVDIIKNFNNDVALIDSLLYDEEPYNSLLGNSPVFISIFSDSVFGSQSVVYSQIGLNPSISAVKELLARKLSRDFGIIEVANIDKAIKIVDAKNNKSTYIAFVDGVLIYTQYSELLSKSINTYRKAENSVINDSIFNRVLKTGSAKAPVKAYVKYSELTNLLRSLVNADKQADVNWLSSFADWTEFDFLIKNNEIILSGFTGTDQNNDFIELLKDQKPVEFNAQNIIPFNTNTLLWLGLSDFQAYYDKSSKRAISKSINFDISKLTNIIDSEIALASSAERISSFEGNTFFVFKVKDAALANSMLMNIARNMGYSNVTVNGNYRIGRIKKDDFVSSLFGDAFGVIKENYFTIVSDYVVMANSESSIKNFIRYYETGKTLDLNDNFRSFSDNIQTNSNILVFIKPGSIIHRLSQYFTEQTAKSVELNQNVASSFQGLSFQLSSGYPLSFTNIYTSHAKGVREENLALWKTKLNSDASLGPFIVSNHNSRSKNIIVFDKQNRMYFVDADGDILWNKKVEGKPMGKVYEVDYYKNNKVQYLFNTENYIYLLDINGRNVGNYPKKLHTKATAGLVIFDYLNNKDYRLVIPQSDKKVYNYTIDGDETRGWNEPKMVNIVVSPVERLLANRKDYIIITDIDNNVKIVNRKGNRRIKVGSQLRKAKNSSYYVNRTNSKGIIITTDESGKLVYIGSSGRLSYTDFGQFSPGHFFLYEDFNGDRYMDFIFIDGNKLTVFDRFKKVLFSYEFGSNITVRPSFFDIGNNQHVLGVVADEEQTNYLFDKKGNIIISKGLVGETQFTVGKISNSQHVNLISAAGNTVYNYRLK